MRFPFVLPRFLLYFCCGIVLIFVAGPSFVVAQQIHALWGFSPDGPFAGSPQQTIAALKDNAINAVFVDRMDPALLKTLHASGVKVFTTVQIFGDHSVWKTYPQLRPVNREGLPLPAKYGSGICPTQRWYWPEILQKISRKANVGYDGVWLDFVRFGTFWETPNPKLEELCFCDSTLADFFQVTGIVIPDSVMAPDSLSSPDSTQRDVQIDPKLLQQQLTTRKAAWILDNHRSAWMQYKTGVIAEFVKQAKAIIAQKPNKLLGVFTVPWRRNEHGDAILRIIGQDYRALADHVDVFSPMLYHELSGRPIAWIGGFVKYAANLTRKPVWPIIQSDLGPEHQVTDEEFAEAVFTALDPPSRGVIIFRQSALIEAKQLPTLRAVWK